MIGKRQQVLCGLLLVVIALFVSSGCTTTEPGNSDVSTPSDVVVSDPPIPDTTIGFRDPSVPISGGTGLPDIGSTSSEEVDCDRAEELCDSGDWACDDIADYCDIGPDDGSELPDDWDWDR